MARQTGKPIHPDVDAANEIYKIARQEADIKIAKLQDQIEGIRLESEAKGIIKKINYEQKHNELLKYAVLCRVKQNKEYRQAGMTWEEFCEAVGEDRRRVDEVVRDFRPIANDFSAVFASLIDVPFSKIRYLGTAIAAESATFEDGALLIDGQKIPLIPENREEIEAAIDALKDGHQKEVEEREEEIRTQKRLVKTKEDLIKKQLKALGEFEGRAAKKGNTPDEEKFLEGLKTRRDAADGLFEQLDPENFMPSDPTPRMKAAYVETVGYLLRMAQGLYDTGARAYDDLPPEEHWMPPGMADGGIGETENQGEGEPGDGGTGETETGGDCSKCLFHKSAGNKAHHGVKIPGGYGKCVRPEGHCSPAKPNTGF